MKRMVMLGGCLFFSSMLAAMPGVTLSGPLPAMAESYAEGLRQTLVYTVTNYVPGHSFPLSIRGISGPLARSLVSNDCGDVIPAGPSSCSIGITITPKAADVGSRIQQTLKVHYEGRAPLTRVIAFTARFARAYVADLNGHVYQCALSTNGSLLERGCSEIPAAGVPVGWAPNNVVFDSRGAHSFAYVPDTNGNVYQCALNSAGGFIENSCHATPAQGAPVGWLPESITFADFQDVHYAYVADELGSSVYRCLVDSTGSFVENAYITTPTVGAPTGWQPSGVSFARFNGRQYAYVTDETGHVFRCGLNADGRFADNACEVTPTTGSPLAWEPEMIVFAAFSGVRYAYVVDEDGAIFRCSLEVDGRLSNGGCVATPAVGAPNWQPESLSFAKVAGVQYAYIADIDNSGFIYRCQINPDGSFSDYSCIATPTLSAPAWGAAGIGFN